MTSIYTGSIDAPGDSAPTVAVAGALLEYGVEYSWSITIERVSGTANGYAWSWYVDNGAGGNTAANYDDGVWGDPPPEGSGPYTVSGTFTTGGSFDPAGTVYFSAAQALSPHSASTYRWTFAITIPDPNLRAVITEVPGRLHDWEREWAILVDEGMDLSSGGRMSVYGSDVRNIWTAEGVAVADYPPNDPDVYPVGPHRLEDYLDTSAELVSTETFEDDAGAFAAFVAATEEPSAFGFRIMLLTSVDEPVRNPDPLYAPWGIPAAIFGYGDFHLSRWRRGTLFLHTDRHTHRELGTLP